MSDDQQPKTTSEADQQLERQIRQERKFTLEEAIMRLAGPGMMKGESPVSGKEQAESAIEQYLRAHLIDSGGTLSGVLLRHVKNSELLLEKFGQPRVVLAGCIQRILGSEYLLKELVRAADAEWGRLVGERPFFEKDGGSPHPNDPYTMQSVRTTLLGLIDELAAGDW